MSSHAQAAQRRNRSGILVSPVYTSAEVDSPPPPPGVEPFTRGIHATMYRGRLWSKRQLVGIETPEAYNARQRTLVDAGQTALSLTTCNSTYRGLDIDEVPRELVGTCGTPINCLADLRIAFTDLPLGKLSFGLNDPSPFTIAAMLLVLAEEQGVPWDQVHGTSNQSDFISHYVANHMFLRMPPEGSLRVLVDHLTFTAEHVPGWNPVSVVGQHMQQAGASPVQVLAFTLATAMEYVNAAVQTGADVDSFGRRVTFFHDVSLSFFEEVAKLRAQRRMCAKIMRQTFGAREERTTKFKVHTQTSGADLTREQPLNNVVRTTVQAMAAILGGTQSLHTDAYDEAYSTPTEEAARVAIMTQHILAEETGLPDVADPLGGSYYMEALTDEMERRAWDLIGEIQSYGGMIAACEAGYVQEKIGETAWEWQRSIDNGDRTIVGVTAYRDENERFEDVPVPRVSEERITAQLQRVHDARTHRNQEHAAAARNRIAGLATDPRDNSYAAVIDGVRAGLTHGEIVSAMRQSFGFGQPRRVL